MRLPTSILSKKPSNITLFKPVFLNKSLRFLNKNYSINSEVKDYGDSLNLPKTNFSMKYKASTVENLYRDRCTTELYQWQLENNTKEQFILHDGPPYANGKLHTGHAMNKILKDIINRYHLMKGHKINYIPGWDCHGLPIELKALAKYKNKKLDPLEIRKYARDSALQTLEEQKSEFKKFGIMADWNTTYKTLSTDYVVRQLKVFKMFLQKGYIYRQFRPVYWSPSTKTALAESELEYNQEHKSKCAYIGFDVLPNTLPINLNNVKALIWTTTPWTIPANKAIAVHPDHEYCIVKSNTDKRNHYLVGKNRIEHLNTILGELEIIHNFTGKDLIEVKYTNMMTKELCPIIVADHVTDDSGTGLVHTAPSHGMEDYKACQIHNISTTNMVNIHGKYTSDAPSELVNLSVLDVGNEKVLEILKLNNYLIKTYDITHSYPYDWRSKKPVIQLATAQWFANLEQITSQSINKLEEVETIPLSGKNRLKKFLQSRSEWCISRQRVWGVPIPVFYDIENGEPLMEDGVIDHVIGVIEKNGTDAWWSSQVEELLPEQILKNGKTYIRGQDTMDVWFDSGTSWSLIHSLFPRKEHEPISDVYLEGSDQHRGWFQSSLLLSIGGLNKLPYKKLITHGFLLDDKGIKQSKSIGNTIEPDHIILGGSNKKLDPAYGADGLRYWIAGSDYTKDITLSRNVMTTINSNSSKIRNSFRFLLANLKDFNLNELIEFKDLQSIDQFCLIELNEFIYKVDLNYQHYKFSQIMSEFFKFSQSFLSPFYFDITKDRLYADNINSQSRRQVQTVLYHVLQVYIRALAPIGVHTCEEVLDHCRHLFKHPPSSAGMLGWIQQVDEWNRPDIKNQWHLIKQLRTSVNTLLAKMRTDQIISSSLESDLIISNVNSDHPIGNIIHQFQSNQNQIEQALIVSNVKILNEQLKLNQYGTDLELEFFNEDNQVIKLNVQVQLEKSKNFKCPRCWKFNSLNINLPCNRCETVLSQIKI